MCPPIQIPTLPSPVDDLYDAINNIITPMSSHFVKLYLYLGFVRESGFVNLHDHTRTSQYDWLVTKEGGTDFT